MDERAASRPACSKYAAYPCAGFAIRRPCPLGLNACDGYEARRNRIDRGWIAAGSRERPALRAEIHPPTGPSRRRISARTRRGSSRSSPFVCHLSLVFGPTVRGMTASIRLCVMDRTVGTRSRQASHRKQPGSTTALRRLAACGERNGSQRLQIRIPAPGGIQLPARTERQDVRRAGASRNGRRVSCNVPVIHSPER
jgi:hypothetical protein